MKWASNCRLYDDAHTELSSVVIGFRSISVFLSLSLRRLYNIARSFNEIWDAHRHFRYRFASNSITSTTDPKLFLNSVRYQTFCSWAENKRDRTI